MKTRIGLIGPQDSVDRVLGVAARYESKTDFIVRIYESKGESVELARQIERDVDVILFTGVIPYRIVSYANVTDKPCLFAPRVGTSIVRALWEMRDSGERYDRISVDSIDREAVEEIAEEIGFEFDALEVVEYEEGTSYEDLAMMHAALVSEGKVDAALTGLSKTYRILHERGIRCYKIYPTKYIIRESIQKAIYIAEKNQVKAYQIAVTIFKLRGDERATLSEYDFLRLKNAFERLLIDYAKGILGSVFPSGRDEYLLFATRGTMEADEGLETLFRSSDEAGIDFCAGLGYGSTAFNAEANARKARCRAAAVPGCNLFSVDVDGEIEGPVSAPLRSLRYSIAETDSDVRATAEATGLSAAYVMKIKSLMRMTMKDRFDVEEFAAALDISERSARRILGNIAAAGRAEVVALESKAKTGRPRRLYELKL